LWPYRLLSVSNPKANASNKATMEDEQSDDNDDDDDDDDDTSRASIEV